MTVKTILSDMSSAEIGEYMAFDKLKDEKYIETLKAEMMTEEQRENKLMALLGYKE